MNSNTFVLCFCLNFIFSKNQLLINDKNEPKSLFEPHFQTVCPPKTPNMSSVDALTPLPNGSVLLLKHNQIWSLGPNKPIGPQMLRELWPHIDPHFEEDIDDLVYSSEEEVLILFKDKYFWVNSGQSEHRKEISDIFTDFPSNQRIDASLLSNNCFYLFRGDKIWAYSYHNFWNIDPKPQFEIHVNQIHHKFPKNLNAVFADNSTVFVIKNEFFYKIPKNKFPLGVNESDLMPFPVSGHLFQCVEKSEEIKESEEVMESLETMEKEIKLFSQINQNMNKSDTSFGQKPVSGNTTENLNSEISEKESGQTTDSITESTVDSITDSITESITESIVEAVTDSITESITESIVEAVTESIVEAVTDSITESVTDSITESVTDSITESVTDLITDSITESVTESVTDSITESIVEAVTDSITDSITESVTESMSDSSVGILAERIGNKSENFEAEKNGNKVWVFGTVSVIMCLIVAALVIFYIERVRKTCRHYSVLN